jgi:heavy metal translocating P-type ATPase
LSTFQPILNETGDIFCCHACREVAVLLSDSDKDAVLSSETRNIENAQELVLTMGDMWCPSCAWLVSGQLRRTPGVISAAVNFIQQKAQITYDSTVIAPKKLKRRVRSLGYSASLPNETPRDEEESLFMRLIGTSALVIHDLVVSFTIYGRQLLGLDSPDTQWLVDFFQIMMLVSSIPVLILLGWPILRAGFASLLRGQPNIHTLITIGTFSAFVLSVRNLIEGIGGLYFDTASMLIYLIAIGRWLEIRAHKSSNQSVERLFQQIPDMAALVTVDGEEMVSVSELQPGMRLRVRPGERFPVDGMIASGEGDIDESLLTGEPKPVSREVGESVRAGTINLDGSFDVITTAVGEATSVGQIGRLLHQALWNRSPLEQMVDKISAWMTPAALAIAAGTYLFWSLRQGSEYGLMVALSVLLIACPCALGLATPLTLWLALGRAAESGVILRSTSVLERLSQVKTIFFDKTGTLSKLPLQVLEVQVVDVDERKFIQRIADAEIASEHPLAQAVVAYAQDHAIIPGKPDDFQAFPGLGLRAQIDGDDLWAGNRRLMERHKLEVPIALQNYAQNWHASGWMVIYAGWKGKVRGVIGLGEVKRAEVTDMLAALSNRGLTSAVLTGDDPTAGQHWQNELEIPVHAALSPADKITYLQNTPGSVAMVGDGINDGPALAAASVGIALNQGTDVAKSAADAVIVNENLGLLPWLYDLSQATMRRVRRNLAWAVVYNLIGVGLAVAGLLQPILSALAMVASSLFVTVNASRMKKHPLFIESSRAVVDL